MKKLTIDRIEEGKAVLECENGEMVNLDVSSLPKNIKEGDILEFADGSYFLDDEETENRKRHIRDLMSNLFEE